MNVRVMFLDGPAKGEGLSLDRVPVFLRVVHSQLGGWDALDQPGDSARHVETVTLYRWSKAPIACFVSYRDRQGRRCGARGVASYELCAEQPEAPILRDNTRWVEWITANSDRLMPEFAKGMLR